MAVLSAPAEGHRRHRAGRRREWRSRRHVGSPSRERERRVLRVYEKKLTGQYWHLAVVTTDALGLLAPNRLGIVDAADYWPWPTGGTTPGPRCFVVTAISTHGLEGPMSNEACGSPVGG